LQSAVLKAPRPLNRLTDAAGFFVSLRTRLPRSICPQPVRHEANPPGAPAPLKEQRRQDCARRHRAPL
jgi:hypothetical protein